MSKQTQKVTLELLAAKMDAGFKRTDKRMGSGFKRLDAKMDAGFEKAEENRESLARMVANGFEDVMEKMATKVDITRLEQGQVVLEQGQENIRLRLESMAPHFEVKNLERRVKRLEDKAGIRHIVRS